MSTIVNHERTGLKELLRALLILLGGFLMALAAYAGQVGYPDDYRGKSQDSQMESRAGLVDSSFQQRG